MRMITNGLCELIFYDGRSERFRAGAASLVRVALALGGGQSSDSRLDGEQPNNLLECHS